MRIHFKWVKGVNVFFFKAMEVLEKAQKNAYNLCIEFSSKMENLKAIKKKISRCDYVKTIDFCGRQPSQIKDKWLTKRSSNIFNKGVRNE